VSKLTDAAIAKLPLVGPDENQYTCWDELPSFGVRISRRSKTFVLKKDNKYHSLGRWPSVSLKQAREEAKRRFALKYFPKTQPSLQTAVQEYMVHQEARLRPGSFLQFRHHINRHFPLHLSFSTLSQKAITDALVELSPSQANHAHNIIKAFLNWCVGREYLDRNPLQAAKLPYKMASRERVLSDDEIRIILKATRENTQFNNIVQFLVYSAQRRTQVSLTQRTYANYQDQLITWPQEVMKSGQQHSIPLTQKFRTLIHRGPRGQYAFGPTPYQAWSRGKKDLDERVNLPHWTLHDLRRTARTNMARLGIPENIAERILAHAPPKLNSVYNRYLYLPAMQDALLKLEEHYTRLLR
jgi:integrase